MTRDAIPEGQQELMRHGSKRPQRTDDLRRCLSQTTFPIAGVTFGRQARANPSPVPWSAECASFASDTDAALEAGSHRNLNGREEAERAHRISARTIRPRGYKPPPAAASERWTARSRGWATEAGLSSNTVPQRRWGKSSVRASHRAERIHQPPPAQRWRLSAQAQRCKTAFVVA